MSYKILICEDEEQIVSFLKPELEYEGYEVDVAYDGEQGLHLFHTRSYHLILLDLMLPKITGITLLREIRKESNIPVLALTARKDTMDKVLLLQIGADDYITKPFETIELLARIKRNIQRSNADPFYSIRELSIYPSSCSTYLANKELKLTKTEFDILLLLMENMDKVLTRENFLYQLYGEHIGDSNVVDVNIRNIRKKLSEHTNIEYIQTVRGKGYVIKRQIRT